MVVTMRTTLDVIAGYLAASGWCTGGAVIGEPRAAPSGLSGAVFMSRAEHPSTTLTGTIERRYVTIRLYIDAMQEPLENTEYDLDEATSQVVSDLLGDFDLGSSVRTIDVTLMTVEYGFQTVGTTLFRIADVIVPMIVDDSATFVA